MALGDVDGDSDLDIVNGNGGQNRLLVNLFRQLDAPLLARIGRTYTLDAYARYAPMDVALPFLSVGTANIPVPPFGTFGLDPALMVPLGQLNIPQPAGMSSLSFVIPNDASLVGANIYTQALLGKAPLGLSARLTNVTADTIQ